MVRTSGNIGWPVPETVLIEQYQQRTVSSGSKLHRSLNGKGGGVLLENDIMNACEIKNVLKFYVYIISFFLQQSSRLTRRSKIMKK